MNALELRIRWGRALLEVACRRQRGETAEFVAAAENRAVGLQIDCIKDGSFGALRTARLSDTEQRVLFVLLALAVDLDAQQMCTALSGGPDPTIAALRTVVYGGMSTELCGRELSSTGHLRRLGYIEQSEAESGDSEGRQRWSMAPGMLAWFHGQGIGAEICRPDYSRVADLEHVVASPSDISAVLAAARSERSVVMCTGLVGSGRRTLLVAAIHKSGLTPFAVDANRLAKDLPTFVRQLKTIARECALRTLQPVLCNIDALTAMGDSTRLDMIVRELLPEVEGTVFATSGVVKPAVKWDRPLLTIEMRRPSFEQRAEHWARALGQGTEDDAQYLANQYPLAPALIERAAGNANAMSRGRVMQPEDIYAGIRTVLDDRLGDYAKRVEVTQTWDDLVLPADQMEAVQYLIARIRQRRTVYEQWGFAAKVGKGLGTSALFSGPPGTGKTMVAALIAKDLGLELYQVDMAKITSKYIGETERNLASLFDAAEAGHAILLFDEADSLFGKRTEVKSSNDRYANLETNYLLQRLESFTGICLLTSNHESNIDPAFQRRLSLHVRFEVPDVDERESLWRAMLPAAAPVSSDVDFMKLARKFAMTGGYIRNAAMRAAFLAADEGSDITGSHLERAARLEYEGMGKIAAF